MGPNYSFGVDAFRCAIQHGNAFSGFKQPDGGKILTRDNLWLALLVPAILILWG